MQQKNVRERARSNLTINQWKTCFSPGCTNERTGYNRTCRAHTPRDKINGHPLAGAIRETEYRPEVDAVRTLFAEDPDHPGLLHTLKAMEVWMQQAKAAEGLSVQSQPYPSAPEVARLVRWGVQPVDILATFFGALYWQQHNRTSRLPDDVSRDFALSHAVLRLAPRAKRGFRGLSASGTASYIRPKFAPLQHLGKHLRQWLAPLYPVVAQALDSRDQQREEVLASMRQPFRAPAVSILQGIKPT